MYGSGVVSSRATYTVRTLLSSSLYNSCGSGALVNSQRSIKNLHQYPHARYKRLVKERIRFSRNWWLTAGNNYELVSDVGHEREATENFGEYRNDSDNDKFLLSTSQLKDLPPHIRLNTLVEMMRRRWAVKDANRGFDKAKMLLQALECFSEMRLANTIRPFDALPEQDQNTFLQYVEGCAQYAQACSHSHPEAVAVLIRAAEICDEMSCLEKRDEMIRVAERACDGMGRSYHFSRPPERKGKSGAYLSTLLPPSHTEMEGERRLKEEIALEAHLKKEPWSSKRKSLGSFITARNRCVHLNEMRPKDPRRQLLGVPERPEESFR